MSPHARHFVYSLPPKETQSCSGLPGGGLA